MTLSREAAKKEVISVHAFDFDRCVFNFMYHIRKEDPQRVITQNQSLITFVTASIRQSAATKAIFMSASARQDLLGDEFNSKENFESGSSFTALLQLGDEFARQLDGVTCAVDRYLLADTYYTRAPGQTFTAAVNNVGDNKNSEWLYDDSKLTIVFPHIQKIAKEHRHATIIYNFYDDKQEIINGLIKIFSQHPDLIKRGVIVRLHAYEGKSVELKAEFVGTGGLDLDYHASVKLMALCAGYDVTKYGLDHFKRSTVNMSERMLFPRCIGEFKSKRRFIDTHEAYTANYLARLGVKHGAPSQEYLFKLALAHKEKIPFDGSNISLRRPENFSLSNKQIVAAFQKGAGGICYQMHGAFAKLLSLLGFTATLATVTMHRFGSESYPYAKMGRDVHCVVLINIDNKKFVIDFAWGDAIRYPLEVGAEPITIAGEDQRRCVMVNDRYEVSVYQEGEWHLEYQFTSRPHKTKDFADAVNFLTTPEHHLSSRLLLMRFDPQTGSEFLVKNIYSEDNPHFIFHNKSLDGTKSKVELTDEAAIEQMKKYGVSDDNAKEIMTIAKKRC